MRKKGGVRVKGIMQELQNGYARDVSSYAAHERAEKFVIGAS